jgi:hypothetical protein
MDAIPPIDWDRFATKDDIAAATILTKAEMELEFANFRTEVAVQFAEVRTEFAAVRSEMRTEFADVRNEIRTEFADVRTEMRAGFAQTDLKFNEMKTEFANIRAEFAHSMRVNTLTTIGGLAALMSVFSVLIPLLS